MIDLSIIYFKTGQQFEWLMDTSFDFNKLGYVGERDQSEKDRKLSNPYYTNAYFNSIRQVTLCKTTAYSNQTNI